MSLEIDYCGRTGNNIFQYIFSRLIAYYNNLELTTPWKDPAFINFTKPKSGNIINFPKVNIKDDDVYHSNRCNNWMTKDLYTNKKVSVRGYFQYPEIYDTNKELVKSWFILPAITPDHKNDIVIHLRLDDYSKERFAPVIHPSWYSDIIKEHFNNSNIYCVYKKTTQLWEDQYIQELNALIPNMKTVLRESKEDFEFIRQFGNIICSNSSFAWWAAWLSEAKKVFVFKDWMIGTPNAKLNETEGWIQTKGKYYWEDKIMKGAMPPVKTERKQFRGTRQYFIKGRMA